MIGGARRPGVVVLDATACRSRCSALRRCCGFLIPGYLQEDPSLAAVYDEAAADALRRPAGGQDRGRPAARTRTHRQRLPGGRARTRHVLECAAVMASLHSPLLVVGRPRRGIARRDHRLAAARRCWSADPVTFTHVAALVVFVGAYVLIATEWVHRVAAALGGAALMLLIGATDGEHAFFSEDSGIDWNVIFLLLGMMLIVGGAQAHRRLRVPGDLGGQTGPRPPVPGHGDPGADHRGRLGAARQRHHGAADRAGHVPGLRPARRCRSRRS